VKQRRIARTELAEVRRRFAEMFDEGASAKSIMVALKLSRSTYFSWKKSYQEHGRDGLKVRPLPGAAPKLTERQTSQLRGWLAGRDPRQFQFDFAL
jgi:transposase